MYTDILPNPFASESYCIENSQLRLIYDLKVLSAPINNSKEAVAFLRSVWDNSMINLQEQFYVLYLNANNEVIAWRLLNSGTDKESYVFVKLVVAAGLVCMASKVIIAHNHPVGELTPSKADLNITNKLYKALELLDIALIDHVILSNKKHFSFIDNNIEIK